MRKSNRWATALALTAALAAGALLGCDNSSNTAENLEMRFLNFNPHIGHLLRIRVVDAASGSEMGRLNVDPVRTPNFNVTLTDVMFPGRTYFVDFYADLSMDRSYDPPPFDHTWRLTHLATAGPQTIVFPHDANWTDIQFPD